MANNGDLQRLPDEILDMILTMLPKGDLVRVCRCQKWIQPHVHRVLYKDLCLKISDEDTLLHENTWRLILNLLKLDPFSELYFKHLRTIHVDGDLQRCTGAQRQLQVNLADHLSIIMERAQRLESYYGPIAKFGPEFQNHSRNRLRTLVTRGGVLSGDFPHIRILSIHVSRSSQLRWVTRHLPSLRELALQRDKEYEITFPSYFCLKSEKLRRLTLTDFSLGFLDFELPGLEKFYSEGCSGTTASLGRLAVHSKSLRVLSSWNCDIKGTEHQLRECLKKFELRSLRLSFTGTPVVFKRLLPCLPGLKSLTVGDIAITAEMGSLFAQLQLFADLFPALESLALQIPNFALNGTEARQLQTPLIWGLRKLEGLYVPRERMRGGLARHLARPFLQHNRQPLQVKLGDRTWSITKGPTVRSWAIVTPLSTR